MMPEDDRNYLEALMEYQSIKKQKGDTKNCAFVQLEKERLKKYRRQFLPTLLMSMAFSAGLGVVAVLFVLLAKWGYDPGGGSYVTGNVRVTPRRLTFSGLFMIIAFGAGGLWPSLIGYSLFKDVAGLPEDWHFKAFFKHPLGMLIFVASNLVMPIIVFLLLRQIPWVQNQF